MWITVSKIIGEITSLALFVSILLQYGFVLTQMVKLKSADKLVEIDILQCKMIFYRTIIGNVKLSNRRWLDQWIIWQMLVYLDVLIRLISFI